MDSLPFQWGLRGVDSSQPRTPIQTLQRSVLHSLKMGCRAIRLSPIHVRLFPPVHKDYFIYKRPERKSGDLLVPALLRRALSNRASPTQGTLIFHSSTLNYGRGHAIIPSHKETILGKISSIRIFPLIALGGKLKFRKIPAPIIGIFFFLTIVVLKLR